MKRSKKIVKVLKIITLSTPIIGIGIFYNLHSYNHVVQNNTSKYSTTNNYEVNSKDNTILNSGKESTQNLYLYTKSNIEYLTPLKVSSTYINKELSGLYLNNDVFKKEEIFFENNINKNKNDNISSDEVKISNNSSSGIGFSTDNLGLEPWMWLLIGFSSFMILVLIIWLIVFIIKKSRGKTEYKKARKQQFILEQLKTATPATLTATQLIQEVQPLVPEPTIPIINGVHIEKPITTVVNQIPQQGYASPIVPLVRPYQVQTPSTTPIQQKK